MIWLVVSCGRQIGLDDFPRGLVIADRLVVAGVVQLEVIAGEFVVILKRIEGRQPSWHLTANWIGSTGWVNMTRMIALRVSRESIVFGIGFFNGGRAFPGQSRGESQAD
jgi:hypothetical protein